MNPYEPPKASPVPRPSANAHLGIHRVALLSLGVVAVLNFIGTMGSGFPDGQPGVNLAPFFGIAIWSFLLWKIWKRPRQWGIGVGIFLFLMVAFQCYVWWRINSDPRLRSLAPDRSLTRFLLLSELPIFVAGVSCILLRFCSPKAAPATPNAG